MLPTSSGSSFSSASIAAPSVVITNPSSLPSQSPLTFVLDVCGVLKRLKRTGWVKRQVPWPESDADHMHRVALTSMLYHQNDASSQHLDFTNCPELDPTNIDPNHLLRMALTHDLCEAMAGDVTPYCAAELVQSKEMAEQAAMEHIARIVGEPLGSQLAGLWREYEDQQTPTAIIVKDIDKFEMLVQATEYEQEHLLPRGDTNVDPLQDSTATTSSINPGEKERRTNELPTIGEEPLRQFFQNCQGQMKTPLYRKLDAELRERRRNMLLAKGWDITEAEK